LSSIDAPARVGIACGMAQIRAHEALARARRAGLSVEEWCRRAGVPVAVFENWRTMAALTADAAIARLVAVIEEVERARAVPVAEYDARMA
jgi:Transposase